MSASALLATALGLRLILSVYSTAQPIPHPCSATYCGTVGAHATCHATGTVIGLTTCYDWSFTPEAKRSCLFKCPNTSCYFIPVYGSDNRPYCTPCDIHKVSCQTNFKVYGPVSHGHPIAVKAANPSSVAKYVRANQPKPVARFTNFLETCSADFCTANGAHASCSSSHAGEEQIKSTCRAFANTLASKEQCMFFCLQFCLPPEQQPIDNTGKKFCSACHLRMASCISKYKSFGPVPRENPSTPAPTPPTAPNCSVGFCTKNGAKARCLKNEGSTTVISCAKWAITPEKKAQCAFACITICVPEEEQPVDNTGRKHCSGCQLQSASCAANFKIFGPVGTHGLSLS